METIRDALLQKLRTVKSDVAHLHVNVSDPHVVIHLKEIFAGLNRAQEALDALNEPENDMKSKAQQSKTHIDTFARYLILRHYIFSDDDSTSAPS